MPSSIPCPSLSPHRSRLWCPVTSLAIAITEAMQRGDAARLISARRNGFGPPGSDALVRSEAAKHRHALAQVLTWTALVIVYCVSGVKIVERLGVPTSSLVAPAAVVGVALGFGAQRLVQDLLSGFFIIAERQYGFGDLISIAGIGIPGGVLHPQFLDAPAVMGVQSIEVDQIHVRIVARTLPGRQFHVGLALRGRIAAALRREGIHVPVELDTSDPTGMADAASATSATP